MSSQTPENTLDEAEYPLGSQKRQERERELRDAEEANKVPESEWRAPDNGDQGEA